MKTENALIRESSPYLLQHAQNPVNWMPYGEEAIKKAKSEKKMIIFSIGYAACHWCHVMEHESFEDEEVAKIMNKHFVCIKIDREERPDIDKIYMDAALIVHGNGGWPLNAFCLPDQRPFYTITYQPKDTFIQTLNSIIHTYQNDKATFENYADQIQSGLVQINDFQKEIQPNQEYYLEDLVGIVQNWKHRFDYENGGLSGAPKFPMPAIYEFLIRYFQLTNDSQIQKFMTISLNKMAQGGIFDHIGGGFARYSVDQYWFLPHFEKMLYDNAQLLGLYAKSSIIFNNQFYKKTVELIFKYVENELKNDFGLYYSSHDADSEGEEGKYYLWKIPEIQEILGTDTKLFSEIFNVTKSGNWGKHGNILHLSSTMKENTAKHSLSEEVLYQKIDDWREKLEKVRKKRIKPSLDDKSLCAWNTLLNSAFSIAYQSFREQKYYNAAKNNIDAILKHFYLDGILYRNFKNGAHKIHGFLDDYASTIQALIQFYQISFEVQYLEIAEQLTKNVIENFYDESQQLFSYKSKQTTQLIVKKFEVYDDVIPSSNSIMAHNLFTLSHLLSNSSFYDLSKNLLNIMADKLKKQPAGTSNWSKLLSFFIDDFYEICIIGENALELRTEFTGMIAENVVFAGSKQEENLEILKNRYKSGETLIYVCKNQACFPPVKTVSEAKELIEKKKTY